LITPSKLSLFSCYPVIGSWWEELAAQKLFVGERPATSSLDQTLFADGPPLPEKLSPLLIEFLGPLAPAGGLAAEDQRHVG